MPEITESCNVYWIRRFRRLGFWLKKKPLISPKLRYTGSLCSKPTRMRFYHPPRKPWRKYPQPGASVKSYVDRTLENLFGYFRYKLIAGFTEIFNGRSRFTGEINASNVRISISNWSNCNRMCSKTTFRVRKHTPVCADAPCRDREIHRRDLRWRLSNAIVGSFYENSVTFQ